MDQWISIWSGVFVTGRITKDAKGGLPKNQQKSTLELWIGIGVALQPRVSSFMVNPELHLELQPPYACTLAVPEYYHAAGPKTHEGSNCPPM